MVDAGQPRRYLRRPASQEFVHRPLSGSQLRPQHGGQSNQVNVYHALGATTYG